jgi:PAS domain S-box-containing protein
MTLLDLGGLETNFFAFQQALDQNIIISATDAKGIIIYVNKKFCEVSQYSTDELMGKSHNIINSGFHSNLFFKDLWKTIKDGKMWHGEIQNKAKDNSLYWVDTVIVPVLNEGSIDYFISLRTLITAKKEAEIALTDAIFNLSHYIRHPMVNMQALLSLCRETGNLSDEQALMAGHMQEELGKIDRLTRKMIEDLHHYKTKISIK